MFDLIRADFVRACRANQHDTRATAVLCELFNPGTQAVIVYRFGAWARKLRWPVLRIPLKVLHFALQYFFGWRVGIYIPAEARIGPGLVIHTWGGGIFLPNAEIGRNLTIIGGGVQMDYDLRGIGDDVDIGPGTKVIGRIRIGHRARTGPNSVLQTDIPDDCVVFGNPGRIIGPVRKQTYEESQRRFAPAPPPRTAREVDDAASGAVSSRSEEQP